MASVAELLFWPALIGYGEAAVALVGEARRPGWPGRLAIWGIRLGWLAQTALLVVQAAGAGDFPWSSRAAALNLFVWLVVTVYLVWACRPRFRLLGVVVMPLAATLLAVAYVAGGIGAEAGATNALLAVHAGLMLAALAGFTFAAGLAAFYVWEERRLKQRARRILRLRVPPLETLDRLAARTVLVSLAALTSGIALGAFVLARDGGRVDAAMIAALGVWVVYAGLAGVRRITGVNGRRAAHATTSAFVFVVVTLAVAHFA